MEDKDARDALNLFSHKHPEKFNAFLERINLQVTPSWLNVPVNFLLTHPLSCKKKHTRSRSVQLHDAPQKAKGHARAHTYFSGLKDKQKQSEKLFLERQYSMREDDFHEVLKPR